jgi:hypothetical protein
LYLLKHERLQVTKVGITTTAARENRLKRHLHHGWEIVELWERGTGEEVEILEQEVLRWWRQDLQAQIAMPSDMMRQGGWSETAYLIEVDIDETVSYVEWLISELLSVDSARRSEG